MLCSLKNILSLEPLTPNHLLLMKTKPFLPPGVCHPEDCYPRRRWRQVQYMADLFLEKVDKGISATAARKTKMGTEEEKLCHRRYSAHHWWHCPTQLLGPGADHTNHPRLQGINQTSPGDNHSSTAYIKVVSATGGPHMSLLSSASPMDIQWTEYWLLLLYKNVIVCFSQEQLRAGMKEPNSFSKNCIFCAPCDDCFLC